MNKNELVEAIALSTEITKTDVDKVVTSLTEVITDELEKGDSFSLKGFGTFKHLSTFFFFMNMILSFLFLN